MVPGRITALRDASAGPGFVALSEENCQPQMGAGCPCLGFAIVSGLHLSAFPNPVIPKVREDATQELCSPDQQCQRDLETLCRCTFQMCPLNGPSVF